MTPQRHTLELALMDLRRCLVDPPMEDRAESLRDEAPDDDLVEALLGVAERTGSRSIAVGALNFLVETGVISDLEALSRIESWEDRNEGTDGAAR